MFWGESNFGRATQKARIRQLTSSAFYEKEGGTCETKNHITSAGLFTDDLQAFFVEQD